MLFTDALCPVAMSEITTHDFFNAVYPEPFAELAPNGSESPQLVIWTLEPRPAGRTGRPRSRCYWTDSIEQAAAVTAERRALEHVFFGVALQNQRRALRLARQHRPKATPASVRGRAESALVLPGVWVDLDVASPTHASDTLPPDGETALGLLDGMPLPASAIVSTGSGYHAYWLWDEAWVLETESERADAEALIRLVQQAIRRLAALDGYSVDATADLARVLRAPGTLNHKTLRPRPARVEYLAPPSERRYDPQDFEVLEALEVFADGPPALKSPRRPPGRSQDYWPPAYFVAIWSGCSFIRFCHQHQERLPYRWWFAMLTIVARTWAPGSDGGQLCHNMSRRYPKYTRAETDALIAQVLAPGTGPCSCAKIADFAGDDHCRHCPHWGRIKGPIVLGRRENPLAVFTGRPGPLAADLSSNPRSPKGGGPPPPPPSGNGHGGASDPDRVRIILSTRENEVADQALAVLAEREPNLFRRGGNLVQVVAGDGADGTPHRTPEAPAARPVQEPRMRELLATHCAFVKPREVKGQIEWRPAHPPQWASRSLINRHAWPELPRLEGLVEGPVLRADGTVLQTPGYDPASGLFLQPAIRFEPVPENPTEKQKDLALTRLMEAVCDFPFAGPAHFSAWLAALLTPLARFAFAGPAPVNLIDANVRGAGKSLLADVCHLIVTGRPAARMPYTRDEAELRKQITAIALKARQLVMIDNVSGAFGSPTLDLAFTTTSWADRLLGQSVDLELPLAVTWYVTGNNIELAGDMPRRCLHIRLETPLEKPEHRSGFQHPRLLDWLAAERRRLLPAALTLLAGYRAEERPPPELRPWGSFEGWSDLIRGTITWLGLPDPADTCGALESTADAAASTRQRLLEGLDELLAAHGGPATVHQILELLDAGAERRFAGAAAQSSPVAPGFETLRTALVEAFPRLKAGELPTPVQLGRKLRSLRGRVIGGRCAVPLEKTRKGMLWAIEQRS